MLIDYDEAKNQKNIIERGLPFSMVKDFDFNNAMSRQDNRHKLEIRIKATSFIDKILYTIIFTMRNNQFRIISLRLASRKERKNYEAKSRND